MKHYALETHGNVYSLVKKTKQNKTWDKCFFQCSLLT